MNKYVFYGILLSFSVTSPVWAASHSDVYELKAVTVTANRQAEDVQSVPANVSIVTAKEIRSRNIQSTAQAVALAAGMQMDQSMEGGVNMRGYTSKNILVMVDGQRVNSGWNGEVMWNMFPVDSISRIEVVRGGQSALYGGRAVGGVINIITETPKHDGVHGSVLESYGTYNTVHQSYNLQGKKGKFTFGGFYENRTTDGWRTFRQYASSSSKTATVSEKDLAGPVHQDAAGKYIIGDRGRKSFMSENYGFNLGYDISDSQKITYKYSHSNYTWKYADPRTYIYKKDGTPIWSGVISMDNGDKISLSDSGYTGTRGFRVYDMHSLTYNDQKNDVHAHFGLTDFTKDGYTYTSSSQVTAANGFSGPGNRSFYPSKTMDLDVNKRWKLDRHTILFGGAFNQEQFHQTISTLTDWKNWHDSGTPTEWHGGKSQSWSVYVQDKWQMTDRLTSYLGARYDDYKKYGGYYRTAKTPADDKTYGSTSYSKVSPKLSLDYAYNSTTNFYTSYGQSFNPPLLYQVYRVAASVPYGSDKRPVIANPGLKPETTTNFEIGMKKKLGPGTQLDMDFFKDRTKDYIGYPDSDVSPDVKYYYNMGTANTRGFELTFQRIFNPLWSAYANYTWQIGKVSGERNYDIPRHLFHAGVTYSKNPWVVHLDGMFVSARNEPDVDTGDYESHDPYFLMNLDANYSLSRNVTVQFSVYNVLNRDFYDNEVLSGRTYNASVRYSF